mgnify:CR=1 FL=1
MFKSKPIQPFTPYGLERDWGKEAVVAETEHYTGKLLLYDEGKAGGLQAHQFKDETFYLFEGLAWVDYDPGGGALASVQMRAGESFHIPPGAVHRFRAITFCVVFETSTPHKDDRRRLEVEYGEPEPADGLPSTW